MPKHYKTGIYVPVSGKCIRTKRVKFRSSWELDFCHLLDKANCVVRWEYETYYIRYQLGGKNHAYLVDFYVELANGSKFLIEIKPQAFYNRTLELQDKNWFKWNAAISFAKQHNLTFKVITEINMPILAKAWLAS